MENPPLNQDINYLQGQIRGLQALLLAVAGSTLSKDVFYKQGMRHLEATRSTLLSQPVAESTLLGVEHLQAWLDQVAK